MIDEKLASWALSHIDGIGAVIFARLINKFGTAMAIFEQSTEDILESEIISRSCAEKIVSFKKWDETANSLGQAIPSGVDFITLSDDAYPSKLKNINDPPPYLFYVGNIEILNRPSIAIVGSRKPSDYGFRMASKMAGEMASSGIVIISGLAYGIDGASHQATLEAGGLTAAVFGCGLDIFYPPGHSALARRIAETGCLLSEFEKGTKPERFNFPVRNRIVSGLADGVLVIEAAEKSGALVTASLALEQGREVLAIPGSVDSKLSFGTNNLIKQGATTVTSVQDIFDCFKWHKATSAIEKTPDISRLSKNEQTIFTSITVQPIHLDEIGRNAGLGHGITAEVLLNLEMKGLIIRKPGNYVVKA